MATGKVKTLYSDKEKTEALFPRTKTSAISDANGVGLDALLENILYSGTDNPEAAVAPIDADTLGGIPADDYATENFVAVKIAEAQLDGGDVDLSGYATKDELNALTAEDVGAAPAGYGLGVDATLKGSWNDHVTTGFVAGHNPMPTGIDGYTFQGFSISYNGWIWQVAFKTADSTTSVSAANTILVRKRNSDGEWGEWEYFNPPMVPGVEYRTTERNDGEVVYAKCVRYSIPSGGIGNASGSTIIDIAHGISNFDHVVRCYARSGAYVLPSMNSTGGSTSVNTVTGTNIKLQVYKDTWSGSMFFYLYYTKDA